MKTQHPHARRRRALGATLSLAAIGALLVFAFFRVQVLASSTYKLQAESNRLRPLEIPAPRGAIFDRNGRIIADNVPGYAVTLLPASPDSMAHSLEQLGEFLGVGDERMERLRTDLRRNPRQPLVVDRDAPFDVVSALEENRSAFGNVYIEMRPKRRYISGPAVSHVLGYIGEITQSELDSEAFPDERYKQGMIVGKTGVERQYEHILQGTAGVRYVEVDASGRIVGDFGGSMLRPGVSGEDIRLNLDLELQEYIHRIFPKDKTGAVVALDPSDGGVLALYSYPTFDPNRFVGGIDPEVWLDLNTDTLKPLYNRAVLGVSAPASTFKPLIAAMALDVGVITPEERMPISCSGGMSYGGRYYRCWRPEGHGSLDLVGAIRQSCDVYFYQVGLELGLQRFLDLGNEIGLSRRCGIDLPQESPGTFPRGPEFWVQEYNYEPQAGEVISMAIGQGPNDQTPLKMAQYYVALARDGSAPPPRLFHGGAPADEAWALDISDENLATLREGLRQVMTPSGTAYYASLEHWDLIGKTGTGETWASQQGLADTDAWFAGMAGPRAGAPEIVMVVKVDRGGGGSATAAPIMAKAADFYLRKKYGVPIDTVQTLREHVMTRGWPTWANQ